MQNQLDDGSIHDSWVAFRTNYHSNIHNGRSENGQLEGIKSGVEKLSQQKMDFFFFFFSNRRFTFLLSILCLILLPSLSSATPSATISTKPSAYEVLEGFDFPIGLLPQGVLDYDLEPSTGKFAAYLNGSCGFSLEGSYQLKYKSAIKGHISNGRLSNLEGVSVKLYFFWVDIVDVKRNGDYIQFSVGIAGADFPIDNFEECPQCGCGINCYGRPVKKLRTNPFAWFSFL